jgi:hypothetical protein
VTEHLWKKHADLGYTKAWGRMVCFALLLPARVWRCSRSRKYRGSWDGRLEREILSRSYLSFISFLSLSSASSFCQNYKCGSSDIDGMIIVLLGRMIILYSSEWTIYTITALSAPYSTIFCHFPLFFFFFETRVKSFAMKTLFL